MGIMTAAEPQAKLKVQDKNSDVSLLLRGAAIVGVVAGILFYAFPGIDLRTSAFFYKGGGIFYGKGGGIFTGAPTTVADFIRLTLYIFFVCVCVVSALAFVASIIRKRAVFGLSTLKWLFLITCVLLGPGLVGNVLLKDHWGRARPVHIVEFGGPKTYSTPLVPSDQCDRNCSFVAGEASMMYTLFFAAAFLVPAMGRRLIITGALVGFFSGIVRMSQGAHFLSDVIFAGVAMALTVAGIYLLFGAFTRTNGNPPWWSW
jgi:lipid A 4'-phosphatase